MSKRQVGKKGGDRHFIIGPYGLPLTYGDLPPAALARWSSRRKAEVVAAVEGGLMSHQEAMARYHLTTEEFLAWQRLSHHFGVNGLRTTRLNQYRRDLASPRHT
jgi:hypothetical protein